MMSLPYEHLNLRGNPFGELDRDERGKLAVVDIEKYQPFVTRRNFILQFTADHGRGKSTHLISLHRANPEIPYVQLHASKPKVFQPTNKHFVDSIENLSFLKRQWLFRRYDWLAVTTHRDLSWEMRLAGKQVKTILLTQNDPKILLELFNRRIEYARRHEGELPLLKINDIKILQTKYQDDIRAMEGALYEHFYHLNLGRVLIPNMSLTSKTFYEYKASIARFSVLNKQ